MNAPLIELAGAGRTYGSGAHPVTALRPADLVVRSGEHVAIVGPSGSGKSTLLNLLGLLDEPTCGRYLLDGRDTAGLNEAHRAAVRANEIGFVFQAFHLIGHRTALANVALGLLYTGVPTAERDDRAAAALAAVGLDARRDALPSTLSGGERQRVAIARALVTRPALLLCDEPTGNLDSRTRDGLLEVLDRLRAGGTTVVVITHDPAVAARAPRTLRITDGLLEEAA